MDNQTHNQTSAQMDNQANNQLSSQDAKAARQSMAIPLIATLLFLATLATIILTATTILALINKYHLPLPGEFELTAKEASFELKSEGGGVLAAPSEIEMMNGVALDTIDVHDFSMLKLQPSKVYVSCPLPFETALTCDKGWALLSDRSMDVKDVIVKPVGSENDDANIMITKAVGDSDVPLSLDTIKVRSGSAVNLEVKSFNEEQEAVILLNVNISKQPSTNNLALGKQIILHPERASVLGATDSPELAEQLNAVNRTGGQGVKYKTEFRDGSNAATVSGMQDTITYALTPHEKTIELFNAKLEECSEKCIPAKSIKFSDQQGWKIKYFSKDIMESGKLSQLTAESDSDYLTFEKGKDFQIRQIVWDREKRSLKFKLLGDVNNARTSKTKIHFSMHDMLNENTWLTRSFIIIAALIAGLLNLIQFILNLWQHFKK
ncbi:MAG: hypothetical protein HYR56_18010 [Acidobacteria bacterium]|nr:hypothetical protein [Acidobacteriota bacterium]MBI3422495.1 hypothetical protein [Acidobacteriota bacterium]